MAQWVEVKLDLENDAVISDDLYAKINNVLKTVDYDTPEILTLCNGANWRSPNMDFQVVANLLYFYGLRGRLHASEPSTNWSGEYVLSPLILNGISEYTKLDILDAMWENLSIVEKLHMFSDLLLKQ